MNYVQLSRWSGSDCPGIFHSLFQPQEPPCDLPLTILWLFLVCAVEPGALPILAPQLSTVFHSPSAWNYKPSHLPNSGDVFRLSC